MPATNQRGRYDGDAVVQLLEDGRRVKLINDFGYIDAASERWDVPAGATVDGASIPKPLWSLIGGPLEGKYRAASIVHDWYCDVRSRPWAKVHRMFFEAMLASRVGIVRARLMYAGVRFGGPKWATTVVANNRVLAQRLERPGFDSPEMPSRVFYLETLIPSPRPSISLQETTVAYRFAFDDADFEDLQRRIGSRKLTLSEVDDLVDRLLAGRAAILAT